MAQKRLGRGLDKLISGIAVDAGEDIFQAQVSMIRPNPFQPRSFDTDEADPELMASIRRDGVLQPLLLRGADNGYELIAGERRWRAAKALAMETVPAILKHVSNQRMLELALVENVQRKDLSPLDLAHAYSDMIKRLNLTQDEVARRIGVSRPVVANTVRLLQLPDEVLEHVSRGTITMGHAKSILALPTKAEQLELLHRILSLGMTVRQTEEAVRKPKPKKKKAKPPVIAELEEGLMNRLGTRVQIRTLRKGGKIVIDYYSNDDFQRILDLLG